MVINRTSLHSKQSVWTRLGQSRNRVSGFGTLVAFILEDRAGCANSCLGQLRPSKPRCYLGLGGLLKKEPPQEKESTPNDPCAEPARSKKARVLAPSTPYKLTTWSPKGV